MSKHREQTTVEAPAPALALQGAGMPAVEDESDDKPTDEINAGDDDDPTDDDGELRDAA
jgi:hypothetical protein